MKSTSYRKNIFSALRHNLAIYARTSYEILQSQGYLDDFIQDFMIEVTRKWHSRKPEDYQEFNEFAWRYARMPVKLPTKNTYSILSLRAIRFSKKIYDRNQRDIVKNYDDVVDLADYIETTRNSSIPDNPYTTIDLQLQLNRIREFLQEKTTQEVVDYYDLFVKDLDKHEISSTLGLSTKDTGLLQERFRYFINRYQGKCPNYTNKKKQLINFRKLDAEY